MANGIITLFLFFGLLTTHVLPIPLSTFYGKKPLVTSRDFDLIQSLPYTRIRQLPPGFKRVYLSQDGSLSRDKFQDGNHQLEIAGSPGSSFRALYVASSYVRNITKYMSPSLFRRLATETSLGIFSALEKLTVFPEYSHLTNGRCGSSCAGMCAQTCTGDGRKIEDLTGIGGRRAVILDDNVLCSGRDPFKGKENILAHEFTHTIHQFAMTDAQRAMVDNAFILAQQHGTWDVNSYAMSNPLEYFAEGATVFFGVNRFNRFNTGGMNLCGSEFCGTEKLSRLNLLRKDGLLYDILNNVFTYGRPALINSLSVCPVT